MGCVDASTVGAFLARLGERQDRPAKLVLLGGSALLLLGNARTTADIALSRLDRGFDSDIADIVFLVEQGRVTVDRLSEFVAETATQAIAFDLDPEAMRRHLDVVILRSKTS